MGTAVPDEFLQIQATITSPGLPEGASTEAADRAKPWETQHAAATHDQASNHPLDSVTAEASPGAAD
jgi:hypothetical protein